MPRILRTFGGIGIAGVLVALAIGAYAFTNTLSFNSNTTPVSLAYNQTSADGYTASGIHFATTAFSNAWTTFTFNLDNTISNDAMIAVNVDTAGGTGNTFTGSNAQVAGAGKCTVTGTGPYTWTCANQTAALTSDNVNEFQVQISQ